MKVPKISALAVISVAVLSFSGCETLQQGLEYKDIATAESLASICLRNEGDRIARVSDLNERMQTAKVTLECF
jgi:hypothetical protein